MSLFGSIQMGGNTLRAMQIGLQVVGNNIANANTPGYVRQEAIYVPAPVQRHGSLILGTGVLVDSIVQKIDSFVLERLVGAKGDRANAEVQEEVYREIEGILNELSEVDLSSALTGFFNSIHEVMLDPGNLATRNLAVGAGDNLARVIRELHGRVFDIQQELDQRVTAAADEINSLAEEIRLLNIQISSTEGGDTSSSQAGGLRVKRQGAVDRLSELVGISVNEQPSGGLSVAVGGEFLVFEGQRREVAVVNSSTSDLAYGVVEFADTHSAINTTGGELTGLYTARDETLGSFLDRLDELAGTLAFEFNKVYSQGQGLVGLQQLTSIETISDTSAALDAAGLAFTPISGALNIVVSSKTDTELTQTHEIFIDLDGIDQDTSLLSLAAQLDAIDGLSASVSGTGALQLSTDSTDLEFSFSDDTSGVLAALGLNTFFTGSTAATLGVNDEVKGIENAAKFAASSDGIDNGNGNAVLLAGFLEEPLESAGNASLVDIYNQLLNEVTQGASTAQSVAEGFRIFEGTLEGQRQSVSGVSIDEEAIKMLTLQRIYQASARYIQTITELLDLLVDL
ncbi:MAG: flagellar hook-associated protein FlgK [Pirellulales bacterium]